MVVSYHLMTLWGGISLGLPSQLTINFGCFSVVFFLHPESSPQGLSPSQSCSAAWLGTPALASLAGASCGYFKE